MNCVAASVITIWTVAPALVRGRVEFGDLVAGNARHAEDEVFSP